MTDHLPPEVLAHPVDRDWSQLTTAQRRHLAACATCRDALVEAAGMTADFRAATVGPAVPADLTTRIVAATSGRRQTRRRRWTIAGTALPAAAVLLIMVLAGQPDHQPPTRLVDPIQRALVDRSVTDMVFPDLPAGPAVSAAFRGRTGDDVALADAVRELGDAYRMHPERPLLAQWLVGGYLALDNLPSARAFVDDALRHHHDHGGLLAVAGLVAYRQGDDVRADSLLTAAIAAGHDGPDVQFNLAVLHLAMGRRHEAVSILRPLAAADAQPLAPRAAELLGTINDVH